jgi:hypothetical protein
MTTTDKLDDCVQSLTALDARLKSLNAETKAKQEEYDQELKQLALEALSSVPWKMSSSMSLDTDILPPTTALGILAKSIRDRTGESAYIRVNANVSIRLACSDGNIIQCNTHQDLIQFAKKHHLTVDTSLLLEKAEEWQKKADDYRQLSLQIIQASIQKKEAP